MSQCVMQVYNTGHYCEYTSPRQYYIYLYTDSRRHTVKKFERESRWRRSKLCSVPAFTGNQEVVWRRRRAVVVVPQSCTRTAHPKWLPCSLQSTLGGTSRTAAPRSVVASVYVGALLSAAIEVVTGRTRRVRVQMRPPGRTSLA